MDTNNIVINQNIAIPVNEIQFRFSRSGGPGGQNVNRVESKVELLFDLKNSGALSDSQKDVLFDKLSSQLDSDGVLHIVSQAHRSQSANREEALARFRELLATALKPVKKRKKTRPPKSVNEKRLQEKSKVGEKKRSRKKIELD